MPACSSSIRARSELFSPRAASKSASAWETRDCVAASDASAAASWANAAELTRSSAFKALRLSSFCRSMMRTSCVARSADSEARARATASARRASTVARSARSCEI